MAYDSYYCTWILEFFRAVLRTRRDLQKSNVRNYRRTIRNAVGTRSKPMAYSEAQIPLVQFYNVFVSKVFKCSFGDLKRDPTSCTITELVHW